MATSVTDFSSLQPSDYGVSDISLQDYSSLDSTGLSSPTLDSSLGTDPVSGADYSFPGYAADPNAPSLTEIAPDASAGLNAYNDGLLPLAPTATVDPSIYGPSGYQADNAGPNSSGNDLSLPGNLPLAPVSAGTMTLLGSAIAKPSTLSTVLGSSLWGNLFGGGGAKAGTAGAYGSTSTVKAAPKTAMGNPISGTSTALIIGVVAALIGMVIWSFSGAK